jgi:hypothetical protein
VDFEFTASSGDPPRPICLVGRELGSGRTVRCWEDELFTRTTPPYPTDEQVLFVAYYASAEIGCHLALGWAVPTFVLDLYAEFRVRTNGLKLPAGRGLPGALIYFGLDALDAMEKDQMRQLALRGGPYTQGEREALLTYCEGDVAAVERLFRANANKIDIDRALLRGRYMVAAARIEATGIPVDTDTLQRLEANWGRLQRDATAVVDATLGVYPGGRFEERLLASWAVARGIVWPLHATGRPKLDRETLKLMAARYPELEPLRQVRDKLAKLRLHDLAVGRDGRARCLLSAFWSRTGRNQPSPSKFVFGLPAWLRGLIRPSIEMALAYIDWEQQEFGIAAALSGDRAMQKAYAASDPYLEFAKQAGAVPADATKLTHPRERELFKTIALAVQYGMGATSLALQLGVGKVEGEELLALHRRTYPRFWTWSDAALDVVYQANRLTTVFGWPIHLGPNADQRTTSRSLRNFPMQANGAEMLRLACCFATERSIRICAPIHDALVVEARTDELEAAVAATQDAMAEASRVVLGGMPLRSEAKLIRFPERFEDPRGAFMWNLVWKTIAQHDDPGTDAPEPGQPCPPAKSSICVSTD